MGYSPWGSRESDKTELLTYKHTHTSTHKESVRLVLIIGLLFVLIFKGYSKRSLLYPNK